MSLKIGDRVKFKEDGLEATGVIYGHENYPNNQDLFTVRLDEGFTGWPDCDKGPGQYWTVRHKNAQLIEPAPVVDSDPPLPGIEHLRAIEEHLAAIGRHKTEMVAALEALAKELGYKICKVDCE